MPRKRRPRTIRPVRPNAGIQAWYEKQLDRAVNEMHNSIMYWLQAEYRKTGIGQDANPAIMMRWALSRLTKRWQRRFDRMARSLSERFVDKSMRAGDASLRSALKRMDMTVEFQMTESMRTSHEAVVTENVNLIKSIPEHHLNQVETLVMQSVSRGRDVGFLAKQLREQHGVTKRRAAFIALDQTNKSSSVLQSQRQRDLGITQGIWKHSGAGKEPRKSHVAADGKKFDLDKGMLIDGEHIMPAQLPRCRCQWAPVIPGFE